MTVFDKRGYVMGTWSLNKNYTIATDLQADILKVDVPLGSQLTLRNCSGLRFGGTPHSILSLFLGPWNDRHSLATSIAGTLLLDLATFSNYTIFSAAKLNIQANSLLLLNASQLPPGTHKFYVIPSFFSSLKASDLTIIFLDFSW